MSLIYTIGYVGSALAPILAPTNLWTQPTANNNKVRLFAGLARDNDEQRSTRGDAPDVVLWDSNGTYISYDLAKTWAGYRGKIGNGNSRDYNVPNENGKIAGPAEYISIVSGGDDGLCLAGVTVATNESIGMTWTGDIGFYCGLPWYASQAEISSSTHRTKCVWIDGNRTPGSHIWTGLSIHMPSFTVDKFDKATNLAESWQSDDRLVCESEARWSMYNETAIPYQIQTFKKKLSRNANGTDDADQVLDETNWQRAKRPFDAMTKCAPIGEAAPPDNCWPKHPSAAGRRQRQAESKRSLDERQGAMADEVVISSLEGSDVYDLCNSATSLGPDYVSLTEGMFCDMSTKTLWPICSKDVREDCFCTASKQMKWGGGELKKREMEAEKVYKRVRTWGS